MISPEQRAEIRRLYYAEHWRVGTIATTLGVHHDTVRHAIEADRFIRPGAQIRPSALDPYKPFVLATLEQYPRLRATRLYEMLGARGYAGSVVQVRRWVRTVRPAARAEAYLRLETLPGEQGQVDWGNFGALPIGRARRVLSCFVLVLSWSRAVYARFALDQTLESFLRGHVEAFAALGGAPRTILYDNLKRRPRPGRGSHPLPSARARAGRPLSLRAPAVRPVPRQREGQGRADDPVPPPLLLRGPSLPLAGGSQRAARALDRRGRPRPPAPRQRARPARARGPGGGAAPPAAPAGAPLRV